MINYDFPRYPAPGWSADYIGVPWLWAGRDKDKGLDCFGLLVDVYRCHFGTNVPDRQAAQTATTDHGQALQTARIIKAGISGWTEVKYPCEGVAVLMRRIGAPIHVGICCGGGDILHSDKDQGGVVRERRADLQNDILGYFIPPGIKTPAVKKAAA